MTANGTSLEAPLIHCETSEVGRDGEEEKELLTASTAGTGRETDPELKVKRCDIQLKVK